MSLEQYHHVDVDDDAGSAVDWIWKEKRGEVMRKKEGERGNPTLGESRFPEEVGRELAPAGAQQYRDGGEAGGIVVGVEELGDGGLVDGDGLEL